MTNRVLMLTINEAVSYDEMAARSDGPDQLAHRLVRDLMLRNEVQHSSQDHTNRLVEVEQPAHLGVVDDGLATSTRYPNPPEDIAAGYVEQM